MVACKRALAKLLILSLLCSVFPPLGVSANGVETIVHLDNLIKNDTKNQAQYQEKPIDAQIGDQISLYMRVQNTGSIPLTNAIATSRFFDDTGKEMSFTGSGFTLVNPDITMSTTTGSLYGRVVPTDPITLPTLAEREYFYFQNYSITLNQDITTSFIRHVWTVSEGNANEKSEETLIHVDTRPQVRSIKFTKETLIGNGVDTTTLQAYVYDGNGCSDIVSVRANLSDTIAGRPLDDDSMNFVSCDAQGVALYELPNIQVTTDPREITVSVTATDSQNTSSREHPEQPSAVLIITQDQSPRVTVAQISTNQGMQAGAVLLDGVNATHAEVTWSADKTSHYYLRKSQNPSGTELQCSAQGNGMQTNLSFNPGYHLDNRSINEDPRAALPANTPITSRIEATELNQNGTWYIRICAATEQNQQVYQGAATITIEKVPTTGMLFFDKFETALTTVPGDTLDITWRQSTAINGTYTVIVNGQDLSQQTLPSTTTNARGTYPGIPVTTRLDASHFVLGTNTVTVQFTDTLGNITTKGLTVALVAAPDPVTNVQFLPDMDFNQGLDIRDIRVQWNAYPTDGDFHSYAVYLLPSTITFQDGVHVPIGYVNSRTDQTGVTQQFSAPLGQEYYRDTDSAGGVLQPGVSYRAYVQVQNKALQRSLATPSIDTKTYAIDGRPEFVSAVFNKMASDTASGSIVVTFDMELDPTRPVDPSLISGTFYNADNFAISGRTLSFTADYTGEETAYHGVISIGENLVFTPSGVGNLAVGNEAIGDGIAPNITIHTPSTRTTINNLLRLDYSFSEVIDADTVIATITLVEGVNDSRAPHTVLLNDHSAGKTTHTVYLPVSDLSRNGDMITTDQLVSGAVYELTLSARDPYGNEGTATSARFTVDTGNMLVAAIPQAVHGTDFTTVSTPTLTWLPAQNTTARTVITNYTVELFRQGEDSPYAYIYEVDTTSIVVPINSQLPTPGVYEFRVIAIDEVGNTVTSQKRPFTYVSEGTVVSNVELRNETETALNNLTIPGKNNIHTAFAHGHTLAFSANITESLAGVDPASITATIRNLADGTETILTNPNYSTGSVVFTTNILASMQDGDYGIQMHTTDKAGIATNSLELFFTVDTLAPVIEENTLALTVLANTHGARIFRGGEFMTIQWNPSGITEQNPTANPITLRILHQGTELALITTQATNSGSYTWEVPTTINHSDLEVELITNDIFSRSTNTVFQPTTDPIIIDNTNPTQYPHILTPNTAQVVVSAAQPYTITWGGNYHDDLTPRSDYFVLAYTHDGGATWTDITTVTTVSGSYDWTVPANIASQNAYIRITSFDRAGNSVSDQSDNPFRIDSTQAEILTATTQDINGNGYIDAIELTYNKLMDENSIRIAEYTVAGYTISHATVNGTIIQLHLTEGTSYDTDATPALTYTQGTATDTSGVLAVTQTLTTIDMASAALVQVQLEDSNENGHLDKVYLLFSEVLAPNTDLTPWTFAYLPAGGTVTAMEVLGDTILFTVAEEMTNAPNTNTNQIQISFAGGTLADQTGNPVVAFQVDGSSISDTLAPVFTASAVEASDSSVLSPVDGQIRITFSEAVEGTDLTTFTANLMLSGFTISTILYTPDTNGFITEAFLALEQPMEDTANFSPIIFSSTGSLITDSNNNPLRDAVVPIQDQIGPKVERISIHDNNNNGEIEEIRVFLSEEVTQVSLSDIYLNNSSSFTNYLIQDKTLHLFLGTELPATSASEALLSWNAGAFTDVLNNPVRALRGDEYTGIDTIGPRLINARYTSATRQIILTFSEPLSGFDSTGNGIEIMPATTLFQITNGGSILGAHVVFDPATPELVHLELTPSNEAPTPQISQIEVLAAQYFLDEQGNQTIANQPVPILGSLIINEINWGETGEEWIELKNLDSTDIVFSVANPYSIYKNDQRIALLTNGRITAEGFFLISKNAVNTNALLDTHFIEGENYLIEPSLDVTLAGPTTYTLHHSEFHQPLTQLDQVGTTTTGEYFAGDNGTTSGIIASMERRLTVTSGIVANSWQTSATSNGLFDTPTPNRRGTPGAENTPQTGGPNINDGASSIGETRTPAPNTLTPSPLPTIKAEYSDGGDGSTLDLGRTTLTVDGVDVTADATVTTTGISYTPAAELQPGRHTVVLTIYDTDGRMAQSTWDFWVDAYQVQITNPPVLFLLNAPGAATALPVQRSIVAVSTYGAQLSLGAQLDGLLSSGTATIPSYQATPEEGLSYEVVRISQDATLPAPDASSVSFTNTFHELTETTTTLAGTEVSATTPSTLQTHYFVIQYRLAVPAHQQPDIYTSLVEFFPTPVF